MKSTQEHTQKICNCITEITAEINKNQFNGGTRHYIEKMESIIIKDVCAKYGLKKARIEAIFYGKSNITVKRKPLNVYRYEEI